MIKKELNYATKCQIVAIQLRTIMQYCKKFLVDGHDINEREVKKIQRIFDIVNDREKKPLYKITDTFKRWKKKLKH